jgi:hypothetical protein
MHTCIHAYMHKYTNDHMIIWYQHLMAIPAIHRNHLTAPLVFVAHLFLERQRRSLTQSVATYTSPRRFVFLHYARARMERDWNGRIQLKGHDLTCFGASLAMKIEGPSMSLRTPTALPELHGKEQNKCK